MSGILSVPKSESHITTPAGPIAGVSSTPKASVNKDHPITSKITVDVAMEGSSDILNGTLSGKEFFGSGLL